MGRHAVRLTLLLGALLAAPGCADFFGPRADDGSPLVEAAWPSPGSASVSVLAALTIRFTVPVDPSSLDAGVRLEAGGHRVVTGLSLYDARTVVVTPRDPLDFGTEYRVVVTPTLTSRAGVAAVETTSWTLTTRGLPPPAPSPGLLRRHLEALAHDSMRGRGSGSADELRAADYLAGQFRAYGLTAPGGGMIQPFEGVSRRGDTLLASRNVVAEVRGSGALADDWLVVGAHYDHIGFRGLPDGGAGPNNGADDNASGTALVLEMARLLRSWLDRGGMAGTDRRSVLFIGFGAEEEGLLGSCHYVFEAPAVPLSVTRAMLNFDMVGRLRDDVLVVSGRETAGAWPSLVENANAPGLVLVGPVHSSPTGTDHACFWQAGIPWLGFFTGYHDQYHTPLDDVALIDFPGLERIGDLGLRILARLMVMPRAPTFVGPIPDLAVLRAGATP
jgi:hypothetical protein